MASETDLAVDSIGTVTTRVGLDGNWVGANHGQSYISFAAEPGEHRVCADWQSSLKGLQKPSGAANLTVEAGKTYYYRSDVTIRWTDHTHTPQALLLPLRAGRVTDWLAKG